jgi:hypothetical protein
MHDPSARGNEFFKCDFCRKGWGDDLPMIEGHRGSLICANCLSVAYAEIMTDAGEPRAEEEECRLCLEHKDGPHWRSPIDESVLACKRCVKQSAGVLHKDKSFDWSKPDIC